MRPPVRIAEQNALEVTVAFLPDAALEGAGLGQLQVARKTAAETQANEAVRVLLRHRLRHAFLIITSLFTVAACLSAVNIAVNFSTIPPRVWQGVAFFSCPFVAFIGLTALLWSRRTLSLAQLRAVEMALVGLFALACVWKQFSYSDAVADLVRRYGDGGTTILAGYHGVFWFALLAICASVWSMTYCGPGNCAVTLGCAFFQAS